MAALVVDPQGWRESLARLGAMSPSRQLWTLFEPVHAVTYFAPEARAAFEAAGLRGFWRGYFAGRVAPLGEAGPVPVTAAFFSFAAPRRWRFPAIRRPGSGTR